MFESNHVQPIKFQVIEDVDSVQDSSFNQCNDKQQQDDNNRKRSRRRKGQQAANELRSRGVESDMVYGHGERQQMANFSLEFSYPAVVLENVCFSVDRSQQQANFLSECIYRLNGCLNFASKLQANNNSSENKVQILKSVNLNVPHGSIFGLLGPSSCGKTTLLRCLVGLLKPSSGAIRLFGGSSSSSKSSNGCCCWRRGRGRLEGDTNCKVPGQNVGYMPQDLGLYEDFTIEQLLTMFGRYMRMEAKLIVARIGFMANFLELPHVSRQIGTLSGGQKRRVSFAIACLHMPPLIILDEPTVGVDPLLRQSIWKYLRRMASEENKTIIITTHYIEEAAQADQVALMRAGEILIQDTPARIMEANKSRTLEEAFLKICNNVESVVSQASLPSVELAAKSHHLDRGALPKLFPQPQFCWKDLSEQKQQQQQKIDKDKATVMNELKLRAEEKFALYDNLKCCATASRASDSNYSNLSLQSGPLSQPMSRMSSKFAAHQHHHHQTLAVDCECNVEGESVSSCTSGGNTTNKISGTSRLRLVNRRARKFKLNDGGFNGNNSSNNDQQILASARNNFTSGQVESKREQFVKSLRVFWALLYKNYRRNVNSWPLLAFQFMLPMIQMISFSLCVGGKPTNVGLGIVNRDQPIWYATATDVANGSTALAALASNGTFADDAYDDSLSLRYLSFIDRQILRPRPYDNLSSALDDVRQAKLWAVLEIGENFTESILKRFDLENFYQLDSSTVQASVIRIYPDKSNKILDMICTRSLVDSYRKFLSSEFEHFRRLPIEIARPIFDIKPNSISNSIDGYTESIAPGLLASLTYIMAAGLTTFIMVVERSAGILERTYTSGINPVAYLLAHALFRSLVMMLQIGAVLGLTFYVLGQPLVGSLWLAYAMLMTLNITGISYGLLISSIVTDQNGAALTIVSSLVVKITMSGILWPFEAIPRWLRLICYVQPLTMPVQALKAITLKGATLGDRAVNLGFLVSISWLLVFLTISTKRFKFYQH